MPTHTHTHVKLVKQRRYPNLDTSLGIKAVVDYNQTSFVGGAKGIRTVGKYVNFTQEIYCEL